MSRYSKFDHFFSVDANKTPRMEQTKRATNGRSDERRLEASPSLQLFNRERRSFSIENTLKIIKEKEDINSRVTDFLTNRKLGLITEEQTKEMKQLKNYNEGNRTKEQTLVFLKSLKKEQDQYTVKTQNLLDQISRTEANTHKLKEKLTQEMDMARFTEETLQKKEKEWETVAETTDSAVYQNQIYTNIIERSKEINVWLKGKIVQLRQVAKSKKIRLESLDKYKALNQKKAILQNEAAQDFASFVRQSSIDLNTHFVVAQQTINSKSELIKAMAENQELKQQAAKEYELKYLSDKKLWGHVRAQQMYRLILNYKHLKLEQTNAPLQHAFAVVKMRTALKDPITFKDSYFQSSETYKDLKERIQKLEIRQTELSQKNRQLTDLYMRTVLETESREKVVGTSFEYERMLIPSSTYEHIDRAKETMSRISLWASRMHFKTKPFIKRRVQIQDGVFKSELLIKMLIQIVRGKLLNES